MSAMTETCTIFLATDGRHSTLGSGDAVEAAPNVIESVQRYGYQGWVAILTGSYYGRGKVSLARVHGLNGAVDADWDAAVAAFNAGRKA